jgi:hypothetical protein
MLYFQVESLLIKNYEDHVNAVVSHVDASLQEENQDQLLVKVFDFAVFPLCFADLRKSSIFFAIFH